MPRSNRPRRPGRESRRPGARDAAARPPRDLESALSGMQRVESHPDGDWIVRAVAAASATKSYRCPGCQQEVPAGTGHLVVWSADPVGGFGDVSDRRHWHTGCWRARSRRAW